MKNVCYERKGFLTRAMSVYLLRSTTLVSSVLLERPGGVGYGGRVKAFLGVIRVLLALLGWEDTRARVL